MTHFMQSFDQVVAFYIENYATKYAEKHKREAMKGAQSDMLQFHMDPLEIENAPSSSTPPTTTTTTTTSTPQSKAFEEELLSVETTLTWYFPFIV